jgi:iron complex outermembrane recepter protein
MKHRDDFERRARALTVLLASTAIFATAQAASAQTAQEPPAATADQSGGLDAIVVTARKVGENLIDVPLAITALSADDLDKRGIANFQDLNDFVPGLRYQNSAANRNDRGFHTITMRGMYPGDSPNRQAVTVFVDGVPIPGGAIPGLTDVQQVEVVKGPQSAYFGRSTFAGAINFITRPPSLTDFGGSIEASYASYSTVDVQASIEGPIIQDRLGIRLSGRYFDTAGQYDNFGYSGKLGSRNTQSLAVGIHAKPIDDLTIRGYFTYWEDSDGPSAQAALTEQDYNCNAGGNGRAVGGLNYICGGIAAAPTNRMSQNIIPAGIVDFTPITSRFPGLPSDFIDHHGLERSEYQANLNIDYSLGDYTLAGTFGANRNRWVALTETYNRPPDGTGYYSTVMLPYNITNKSAELRLSSPADKRFSFLLGGNYYQESIYFMTVAFRPGAGGVPTVSNLTQPSDYRAKTFGLFGSASYELLDGLKLSAEARYQWDTINHVVRIPGGADLEETFKSFSPRVILNYEFAPSASAYVSWARGTRPGTFNLTLTTLSQFALDQIQSQFDVPTAVPEETLNMFEAGIKGEFFDRRLRVLATAYYGLWRDRQINQNIAFRPTPTSTTVTTNTFTLANGKTDLWGLELESSFRATDALSFDATFNWAHTRIVEASCTECVAINGVLNPVGNSMERYPEFSGTFAANYDAPISDRWSLISRVDAIYTGRQYATAANVAWLKPSVRVNARIGIRNDTYSLEIFGRNVFDNKRPTNILRNANPNSNPAQGLNLIILAAPERATVGVRGTARF